MFGVMAVKKRQQVMQIIIGALGFLMFGTFAPLQYNDLKQYGTEQWLSYAWLFLYAVMAILSLLHIFKSLPRKLTRNLAVMTFLLAAYRTSQIDWSKPLFCINAEKGDPNVSPAGNEAGGLLIVTLWLLLLYFSTRKSRKGHSLKR